jgi:hypothetical protein
MRRAFGVLDPGGRTRTGITRMDSPVLYQLSYPGVVPEVYVEHPSVASGKFGHVLAQTEGRCTAPAPLRLSSRRATSSSQLAVQRS